MYSIIILYYIISIYYIVLPIVFGRWVPSLVCGWEIGMCSGTNWCKTCLENGSWEQNKIYQITVEQMHQEVPSQCSRRFRSENTLWSGFTLFEKEFHSRSERWNEFGNKVCFVDGCGRRSHMRLSQWSMQHLILGIILTVGGVLWIEGRGKGGSVSHHDCVSIVVDLISTNSKQV